MARIAGFYLPKEKRVEIGLTYILGIGLRTSQRILKETKISPDTRVKDLTSANVATLQNNITDTCVVGGDLRKEVTMNIKRLQEILSYRGLRHKRSLPTRGQRTKTNARTRKGPKRAGGAIAKKKIATKK